jgi:hypothetical protein
MAPPVLLNEMHSTQMAKNTVGNDRNKTEISENQGIKANESGNRLPSTGDFGIELNR